LRSLLSVFCSSLYHMNCVLGSHWMCADRSTSRLNLPLVAARERFCCLLSSIWNPDWSIVRHFSLAISCVSSNGKPKVSYNLNVSAQLICWSLDHFAIISSSTLSPLLRVFWNVDISVNNVLAISLFAFVSICSRDHTWSTISSTNFSISVFLFSKTTLRYILLTTLLRTYPLHSFDGLRPERINADAVLVWSDMILWSLIFCVYVVLVYFATVSKYGLNKSVSKTVSLPWRTNSKRSNPIPVSTFFCGSSVSLPEPSL